jgi:hypothetical protein
MADNIKIIGNIVNTITTLSRYDEKDIKLIPFKELAENFGEKNDYIEFYIYDITGNLLIKNYNYLDYKLPPSTGLTPGTLSPTNTTGNIQTENIGIESTLSTSSSLYPIIEIDPIQDLQNEGYSSGEYNIRYNLFQGILSNYIDAALFIKEISSDRTEIRLGSTSLTDDEIESVVLSMIDKINNSDYYVDYLLNFGNNEQYVAINVVLNKAVEGYEVLFKLYKPLPTNIQEKQTLWVVEEKVGSYVFDINLDKFILPPPSLKLRGPNFGIEIPNHSTISTTYTTYGNLIQNLQSIKQSSYHQILNLLATQSIDINTDYTNFSNFVFFGSSYQRVINFYTKIKQIEDYNNLINTYTPQISSIPSLITEINQYSSSISNIISQFDGYEYYLYFESSSYTWPKSGSLKPYELLSTGSLTVNTWYISSLESSSYYDENNPNNLEYAVPNYLRDDKNNQPFLLFLNMIGHYFDNIWVYLQSVTNINKANNNLNAGISKDIVYQQLKSLGLHLYNSQAGEDVDKFLIGANTGSSTWNNNTTITGSYLNNIPRKDLVSELYKRIYHNLPLLLKQKGTVEGLDNLISIFGIPSRTYYVSGSETFYTPTGSNYTASLLNVKEYGGSTKAGLVKGYNTDKVRIVANTIEGSVLSPLRSLQTFPTDPSDFRDGDMHYIDISFSPQTQIDTYASKSIASNNPTWSLDDFIGDPRQQYSGSYSDLETQRKLYYQTGVAGYPGFTGSLMDYNGFIRLIQYFDNSLFKMLEDFVPERASLSTGVTINSPVLERNKAVYANPTNSTTQSVYEAEYSASTITGQYGHFYDALQNDKKPFFDGVISGSTVDVHQYFIDNYNPYLQGDEGYTCDCYIYKLSNPSAPNPSFIGDIDYTDCDGNVINTSLIGTTPIYVEFDPMAYNVGIPSAEKWSCSRGFTFLNQNQFEHTDWNVLLNNVSESVLSSLRQNIEYTAGDLRPTSSITYPAELQDSYLSLRSYNISRYEGSKLTSLKYNTYTSASYTGSDGLTIQNKDISYGKSAVIDRNNVKIALFTQATTQSIYPGRTFLELKYLIDKYGSLTELNQENNNWVDVQNIFKMSETASISLFDPQKYSNQTFLNGNKRIYESGYKYTPVLYGGGDWRGGTGQTSIAKLFFDNLDEGTPFYSEANNISASYFITGGQTPYYNLFPLLPSGSANSYGWQPRIVGNLYNNVLLSSIANDGVNMMTPGKNTSNKPTSSIYTVPEGGLYAMKAKLQLTIEVPPTTNGTIFFRFYPTKNNNRFLITSTGFGNYPALGNDVYGFYFGRYDGPQSVQPKIDWTDSITFAPTAVENSTVGFVCNNIFYPAGTPYYVYRGRFYKDIDAACNQPESSSFNTLYSPVELHPSTPNYDLSSYNNGACSGTQRFKQLLTYSTLFYIDNWGIDPTATKKQSVDMEFKYDTRAVLEGFTFEAGDKISVKLEYIDNQLLPPSENWTGSFTGNIYDQKFIVYNMGAIDGVYAYAPLGFYDPGDIQNYRNYYWFQPEESIPYYEPAINQGNPKLDDHCLVLSSNLSAFYGSKYLFIPHPEIGPISQPTSPYYSGSVLTGSYGDVDYPFYLEPQDVFAFYDENGYYFESRITEVFNTWTYNNRAGTLTSSLDSVAIRLEKSLPTQSQDKLYDLGRKVIFPNASSNIRKIKFLFLKRVPDETGLYIKYKKRAGQTSFGLLIPNNLPPEMSSSIDAITKEIKLKVQTDQQQTN